jgi:broad specificity phosphatase PhoE
MLRFESLTVIRHGESAYNELREKKKVDPVYSRFLNIYPQRKEKAEEAKRVALELADHLKAAVYDNFETPLTNEGRSQAQSVGMQLRLRGELPDLVVVSPHVRARDTFDFIKKGWPEVSRVTVIEDERIREQERGLYLNFNDWKIFTVFYPEQEELMSTQGHYWYRYPQGENIPDVRLRVGAWLTSIIGSQYKNVLAITHHIPILAVRSNLENIPWLNLMELDKNDTPINCGVTRYSRRNDMGEFCELSLNSYNQKLY